ncbi:putative mhyt domain signaling protein [Erysiphe neolycopersici]|uniref:Putative mhyt domain signaling protein n=1 Tax=Erysiphe neolycopersici TaxID=212602 RepID=A0A420I065_9PEZI|nr:putative mhyt domain signaling protein [Erysiphe neolycopersici]
MSSSRNNEGSIVSRRFASGFIILSYFISYIGSWATLELISRRTSNSGLYNWLILTAASLSMGGTATWCLHYLGNQAIILADGQINNQIKYNLGLTIISFLLPITMAFLAFVIVGSDIKSEVRVIMGGIFNSFGILGMHFMSQAAITNYQCSYKVFWILGAFILSFLASVTGLSQFFLIRLSWKSSWWKRAACAFLITAGISFVHWLSSMGTVYQLHNASFKPMGRSSQLGTIVVISTLSVLGCLILLGLGIVTQSQKIKLTKTVQQLVLAVATFDQDNKILVTASGNLPLRRITEAWLEQTPFDEFNIAHPVFLWMFRTSQNWSAVMSLVPAMRSHIRELESKHYQGIKNILTRNDGIPINEYSSVFEELFCVKSADLANDLDQPLEGIGVLFDEIINTEQVPVNKHRGEIVEASASGSVVDLENDVMVFHISGKGQIIFLVNRVGLIEAHRMKAAGYRFADVGNIISILATKLQVKEKTLAYFIKMMQNYTSIDYLLEPGLYFSIFAIRASITHRGFEVLALRKAKNQLPSMKVDVEDIKNWTIQYLTTLKNMSMVECINHLSQVAESRKFSYSMQKFATSLLTSLKLLRENINDITFDDSLVADKPFEIPCRVKVNELEQKKAVHIVLKILLPIHKKSPIDKLVFVPLDFFKIAQHNNGYNKNFQKKTHNHLTTSKGSDLHSAVKINLRHKMLDIPEEILKYKHKMEKSGLELDDFTNKKIPIDPLMYCQRPAVVDGELTNNNNNFVDELFEATISLRKAQTQAITGRQFPT